MPVAKAGKRWVRAHGFFLRISCVFLFVGLSVVADGSFEKDATGMSIVWLANGLLLSYLLLAPRWRFLPYIFSGTAGMVVGSYLIREPWTTIVLYNALNMLEVLIAARLLKRKSTQLPGFTDGNYLLRFIAIACVLAPGVSGIILGLYEHFAHQRDFLSVTLGWFMGDFLGIAVIAPTFVAILQSRFRNAHLLRRGWYYPILVLAVTILVFNQNRAPLLFLIVPFLVLVLTQLDLGWAALSTLVVAIVGGWFSVHNMGPIALATGIDSQWRAAILQLFLVSALFILYLVSVVFSNLDRAQKELRKIVALHRLVVDNSRDIIILGSLDGKQDYVSPGVKALTGWECAELVGQPLQQTVHPTYLAEVEKALRLMQTRSLGGTVEYRSRKKDGSYFWVEANLRVYRDPVTDLPTGFLNLVRDISERKRTEETLQAAYRAMETLVVVDALTGIANRRRFDDVLATEWRRSLRMGNTLSLLLIDVDFFKAYNDTYGHVRGDGCLKQIAEASLDVVLRPADLVARYGGEEFAVVLPSTDEIGAKAVGDEILEAVRNRRITHKGNPFGIVTVSIGCATVVPQRGLSQRDLLELADKALYAAKGKGRNQLVVAPQQSRINFPR